ncbi:MAG TPA: DUF433 domain-containing protein [Candidatus Dormibacteraeota bacterium]|nr:DUF433 domain-containing protein [Candidatus Dormibacteraeota bacterium]
MPIAALPPSDPRVGRGLFTVTDAAGWLTVPRSTFHGWVYGYEREERGACGRPIVLSLPARRGEPAVPFLGLAEGLVLNALRRGGVPLQRIRPALERLDQEMGLRHALASDRLTTDGVEVLYEYGARQDPAAGLGGLATVRNGQLVLAPVVRAYLSRVQYGSDGWAERLELPGYAVASVVIDPGVAGGRPVLADSHIPVEQIVQRWLAGASLPAVADTFALRTAVVEDVIRAATRRCCAS